MMRRTFAKFLYSIRLKFKVVLVDLSKDLDDGFARLLRLKFLTEYRGWNGLVLSSSFHSSIG
jgi:hypothetical protein